MDIRIFDEPKIDCHVHVLDPARFPYGANTHYRPLGQEMGTPAQLAQVMDAYGTRYALLVGPNSGYGLDNACLLDTIARGSGRYKGVAVVANDATLAELQRSRARASLGVAWNVTITASTTTATPAPLAGAARGARHVRRHPGRARPARADAAAARALRRASAGRPLRAPDRAGLDQPGFRALLELAATGAPS